MRQMNVLSYKSKPTPVDEHVPIRSLPNRVLQSVDELAPISDKPGASTFNRYAALCDMQPQVDEVESRPTPTVEVP